MPDVAAQDARIHYDSYGAGPALTFAHGAGGNGLVWFRQVPYFSPRWRVITFDHRGFGRSTCAPEAAQVRHFPDDLARVLDQAKVDRTALVCQSMGGWTGLPFALRHPDRVSALVLSGTPGGVASEAITRHFAAATERARAGRPTSDLVLAPEFRAAAPDLTCLYDALGALNAEGPGYLKQLADPARQLSPEAVLELAVPTLVVAGESDPIFPPSALREVAERLPGARFEVLPTGHSPYYERPDLFNPLVASFLDGL